MLKNINFNGIRADLEARRDRSAWDKGVTLYAFELLDVFEDSSEERAPRTRCELEHVLLNGSDNWGKYAEDGSGLTYETLIAERLCTPSELKRYKGGELNPGRGETWYNLEARALYQAARRILQIYKAKHAPEWITDQAYTRGSSVWNHAYNRGGHREREIMEHCTGSYQYQSGPLVLVRFSAEINGEHKSALWCINRYQWVN